MPDLVTHFYFGEEVYKRLSSRIKDKIVNKELYDFTTAGPDPFFFYKFLNGRKNEEVREFGNRMHRTKTRKFFLEMIERCKTSEHKNLMFSYLAGFICHYALDSLAHPYVFHKTGEYLKNEETLIYRGLHTRLERAIDSYIIRCFYLETPWKYKITKNVLKLKKLPKEIYNDLDQIYLNTYDYPNASKIINDSIKYQRKFYNFIYDPVGLKQKLFEKIDNGKSGLDYTTFSYYKKEIYDLDYFNLNRRKWVNPVDDKITSFDSFWDLFEKAKTKADELIEIAYRYIYEKEDIELSNHFLNKSYLTGIDTDLDNAHDMKYYNNIFEEETNA